jgi:hypothetical protein
VRIQHIIESVGLARRQPGQIFANPQGQKLSFVSLDFYPEVGQFASVEERDEDIQRQQSRLGQDIEWTNTATPKMLAYGLAVFQDPTQKTRVFGRFFSNIKAFRQDNNWPNDAIPGGYRYQGAAAVKATSGLMPQDVLKDFESLYPDEVFSQVVSHFGEDHPLTAVTEHIVNAGTLPYTFPKADISFTAFRDYFCEILQPVALIRGVYSGNAGQAAERFMGAKGFDDCVIDFDTGKTAGLYDSLLISPDGRQIKVSTKGGAGAKASVKNLIDTVEELEKSGNQDLLKQFDDTVEMIRTIRDAGQHQSPLQLAQRFGLITAQEAKLVNDLRTDPDTKLTPKLQSLFDQRPSKDPAAESTYYRMLAAIAHQVAKLVNDNTDFSQAATTILNNAALVQVYTVATESQDSITLKNFGTLWPSDLIRGVYLDAGKTYYNTGIKGNFTFSIDRKPVEDVVATTSAASAAATVPDQPERAQASPRRARRDTVDRERR